MELVSVRLVNFRVFEDATFDLKPLTILTGPNSSGKSSLFKALLLLQDNLIKNGLSSLEFDQGAKHGLGAYNSIVYKNKRKDKNEKKKVSFALTFKNLKFPNKKLADFWGESSIIQVKYEFIGNQPSESEENGEEKLVQCTLSAFEIKYNGYALFCLEKKEEEHIDLSLNINQLLNLFSRHIGGIWESIRIEQEVIKKILNEADLSADVSYFSKIVEQKYSRERQKVVNSDAEKTVDIESDKEIRHNNEHEDQLRSEIEVINKKLQTLKEKFNESNNEDQKASINTKIDRLQEELDDLENRQAEIISQGEEEKDHFINEKNKEAQSEHQKKEKEEADDKDSDIQILNEEEKKEIQDLGLASEDDRRDYYFKKIISSLDRFLLNKFDKTIKGLKFSGENEKLWNSEIKGEGRPLFNFIITSEGNDNWGLKDALRTNSESTETEILSSTIIESLRANGKWDEQQIAFLREFFGDKRIDEIIRFNELDNILFKEIVRKLSPLIEILRQKIPFIHFSASRGLQQRIFSYTKTNNDLEEAISELYYFIQKRGKENPEFEFLRTELDRFEIGKDIRIKLIDGSSFQAWATKATGIEHSIADFGFGITQLLPILIKTSLRINKRELVAIEEPGTNLHPTLQSRLAEFYLAAIDKNTSFVLETHSEYLIRKLQAIVAELPDNSEKIKIFYLKEGKIKTKININKEGGLSSHFPPGFFDESERLIQEKEVNKALFDKVQTLEKKVKKSGLPLIITEGKTDWKHMKRALKKFMEFEDRYEYLAEFMEFETSLQGDSQLKKLISQAKDMKSQRKIIGIFDNDSSNTIKSMGNKEIGYKYHGNNVYSFCIPIPKEVGASEISIEHYYPIDEIKTKDLEGKRLFLYGEFDATTGVIKTFNNGGEFAVFKEKRTRETDIVDRKVYNLKGEEISLLKSKFAEYVYNSTLPFDKLSYKNFSLIFDLIQKIKDHKA